MRGTIDATPREAESGAILINRIYIASHGAFSLGSQLLAPNFCMARKLARMQSGIQDDQSERA